MKRQSSMALSCVFGALLIVCVWVCVLVCVCVRANKKKKKVKITHWTFFVSVDLFPLDRKLLFLTPLLTF